MPVYSFTLISDSLFQLSQSLGNQKPEILIRVEKEIWIALSKVCEDSSLSNIHIAFRQLFESDSVVTAMKMLRTDPVFSFFQGM